MTDRTRPVTWRYGVELGGAFAIYALVLFLTIPARDAAEPGLAKSALALAPILPLIFVFGAILRQYARFDELMKRINAEAFALGAMLVGWGMTIWGFGVTAGWPALPLIWIGPALMGAWGLCLPIVLRRYK